MKTWKEEGREMKVRKAEIVMGKMYEVRPGKRLGK